MKTIELIEMLQKCPAHIDVVVHKGGLYHYLNQPKLHVEQIVMARCDFDGCTHTHDKSVTVIEVKD